MADLELVPTGELFEELSKRHSTAVLMTSPPAGAQDMDLCVYFPVPARRNTLELLGLLKMGPQLVRDAMMVEQFENQENSYEED